MDPIIGGALIGAGASLAGGALGGMSSRDQYKFQKKFAKKGIQWRVADAKAAGLHPLYALGAQVPSYTPVSGNPLGEALSDAGQNIGRAIAARETPAQRMATELAIAQAKANLEKTHADTAYVNNAIRESWRRQLSDINEKINAPLPEVNVSEKGSTGTFFGGQAVPATKGVPSDFITPAAPTQFSASSKDAGTAAGITPMMREFRLPGGLPIALPGGMQGDASEALESLTESPLVMYSVFKANVEKYGPQWGDEFIAKYVPGGEAYVKVRSALGRILYRYRSGEFDTARWEKEHPRKRVDTTWVQW